jgi:hypothetical protein
MTFFKLSFLNILRNQQHLLISVDVSQIHSPLPSCRITSSLSIITPNTYIIMKFTMFSASGLALFSLITAQQALSFALPSLEHALEKRSLPVVMGLAKTFGAIAASTLTSTGNTVITGDGGTCPGTSITGFPPGICTGTLSAGGTAACNAEAACLTAYNNAKSASPVTILPSSDLAGVTLPPGIYGFPTSGATLTGTFTANGATNHHGQWIFQVKTTFTTAVGAKIVLENGAQACNIYFQVGSSITIAGGSKLSGNFLAYTSIAAGEAASVNGTLCALNGAVTLIDDAIRAQPVCVTS